MFAEVVELKGGLDEEFYHAIRLNGYPAKSMPVPTDHLDLVLPCWQYRHVKNPKEFLQTIVDKLNAK
jgi:hypothetical protein